MVNVINLSSDFQLIQTSQPSYSDEIEARVEELWQAALLQEGNRLFDGPVFCAIGHDKHHICGYFTGYRYVIAQQMDPRLKSVLKIKPVSIMGFLSCKDGILFGKRQQWLSTRPNEWGFMPSGYICPDTFSWDGSLDFVKAFLIHLQEELNIEAHHLNDLYTHSLVVDQMIEGESMTIIMRADIEMTSLMIKKQHMLAQDDEYSEVVSVPYDGLETFARNKNNKGMQIASALLSMDRYLTLESKTA